MTSQTTKRPPITPQLLDTGIVAILRASSAEHVLPAARTLVDSGIRCLEITLTVPGALDTLARLVAELPSEVAIGAGTVTSRASAVAAVASGAAFLVCPTTAPEVVAYTNERGIACYPGAWTPTEVASAWDSGAAAVKLFPAASGGPAHLRRLREPLPDVAIVPTGGIGVEDIGAYLTAGAVAVGLGGPLLGDALAGGDLTELAARSRKALAAASDGGGRP